MGAFMQRSQIQCTVQIVNLSYEFVQPTSVTTTVKNIVNELLTVALITGAFQNFDFSKKYHARQIN